MSRRSVSNHQSRAGRSNLTSPGGCLRFDRRFGDLGVPRLQHSSGTRDTVEFERRNRILTRLARLGAAETLQAFASGEIDIDDLIEFERGENLAGGLRDRRARLAQTQPSSAPMAIASPPMQPPQGSGAEAPELHENLPQSSVLTAPLWSTALETAIPAMTDVDPATRRRYATSIRSMRQKLGAFSLSEASFETLAEVESEVWADLQRARMRGLTVTTLRDLIHRPAADRRAYLKLHDIRVNDGVFLRLASVGARVWNALATAAEFPIDEQMIILLDREGEDMRVALRRIAGKLGQSPTVGCLRKLNGRDWQTMSKRWASSGSDWNHMRRSLSAVLTSLFGTHRHPVRHQVIDAIPLRKEAERVPNISPLKLAEVVEHLPEAVRFFPWCLVLTGCRIGEYLRLTAEDLQPYASSIRIRGTKTDGSDRTVYIDSASWWIIDAAIPCYLQYGQLRRHWIAACTASGLSGVTLHDLRHCSGQWAVEGGADEGAIQDHLGHATRQMTARYTRRANQGRAARALSDQVLPFVKE
jgi:integrase